MKASVVVGMQYGSEGKGAVCAFLAETGKYSSSVRVQSTQAGHTVFYKGKSFKMRTLPCAWVNPDVELVLGAGCFIERQLLLDEIEMVDEAMGGSVKDRLTVDFRVSEVTEEDVDAEIQHNLEAGIGSTVHGCGSSLIRKIWRDPKNKPDTASWLRDNNIQVADTIHRMRNHDVLVEGCQGTMLALHTSPHYPFVTSRESTASGICAEAGISPVDVKQVYGVFRTLPIRVGGNSGDTGGAEISWDEVRRRAGYNLKEERTTVTNRVRRVFEWSDEEFVHALRVNRPTGMFMTFANYLAPCYGAVSWTDMPQESMKTVQRFIDRVERLRSSNAATHKVKAFNTSPTDWIYI